MEWLSAVPLSPFAAPFAPSSSLPVKATAFLGFFFFIADGSKMGASCEHSISVGHDSTNHHHPSETHLCVSHDCNGLQFRCGAGCAGSAC